MSALPALQDFCRTFPQKCRHEDLVRLIRLEASVKEMVCAHKYIPSCEKQFYGRLLFSFVEAHH